MLLKLFRSELKRNKVVNLTLFMFVMLSSLLASSALYLTITLFGGVEELVTKADTPHFVQMHAGEVEEKDFLTFHQEMESIESFQLQKMIGIPGNEIFLNDNELSEAKSVMDVSLVKQNLEFDFLLDMHNEVAKVEQGEIGVPIFYMRDRGLQVGDQITFVHEGLSYEFVISTFIRDSQMNPALVSSKRFLLSEEDYLELEKVYDEFEYLIEYKLRDTDNLAAFSQSYQDSNMPSVGPMVDINLFKTINALTDGIVVIVLVFVSFLLTMIGILCLRYTLLSTVEEDIREIGVMKAIGIHHRKIQFMYMSKYLILTLLASVLGYSLSFVANELFVRNITEYMGVTSGGFISYIVPMLGVLFVFFMTMVSIWIILRRLKKIAIVDALIGQQKSKKSRTVFQLKLKKTKAIHVNIFVGLNKVLVNLKAHSLIILIFILSTFIMIVPLNMLTTISSPHFINYMGVGESDLRLDVRNHDASDERVDRLVSAVQRDKDVDTYGVFKTYGMKVLNRDGETENIPLEVGDWELFPLDYLEGRPPQAGELSLSVLAAESIGISIGDTVRVVNQSGTLEATLSGIYQDITNGGKTAKSVENLSDGSALWYVINLNLKDHVRLEDKRLHYSNAFSNAKVTDVKEYIHQTLSGTINQLKLVAIVSFLIACIIGALITGLFLKMMLAKESREIGVLLSIGFHQRSIRTQYMIRLLSVLLVGIIMGSFLAATLGQQLISVVGGLFGASAITFIVNPGIAYVLLPVLLAIVVMVTSWFTTNLNQISSINRRLME